MANYSALKAAIQAAIYENGNNEITGAILQQSLLSMITSLGDGYQFMGIATPSTNPGTPDGNVFYLASTAGTYPNFGGLVVSDGEVAIFEYNGTWFKEVTGAATAAQVAQLASQLGVIVSSICDEEGLFFVDELMNIGVKIDNNGFDAINALTFEIV